MSDEYDVLIEISADDVKKVTEERDNRDAEITRLREENARLRKAVKSAYYEGWQDNASIDDTADRLHAEWEFSEACAAIREGKKDEN